MNTNEKTERMKFYRKCYEKNLDKEQIRILLLKIAGFTDKDIATILSLNEAYIKVKMKNILRKLKVNNKEQCYVLLDVYKLKMTEHEKLTINSQLKILVKNISFPLLANILSPEFFEFAF